jgi:hypothetical protein
MEEAAQAQQVDYPTPLGQLSHETALFHVPLRAPDRGDRVWLCRRSHGKEAVVLFFDRYITLAAARL